jgi:hypothetical protein
MPHQQYITCCRYVVSSRVCTHTHLIQWTNLEGQTRPHGTYHIIPLCLSQFWIQISSPKHCKKYLVFGCCYFTIILIHLLMFLFLLLPQEYHHRGIIMVSTNAIPADVPKCLLTTSAEFFFPSIQ